MASTTSEVPPKEIVIISHSTIFYWWPVWLVGFLMAAFTYLSGQVMAYVPPGTVAESSQTVPGHDGPRDVLVLRPGSNSPWTARPGRRSSRASVWPSAIIPASFSPSPSVW